jgi:hypothetical protein
MSEYSVILFHSTNYAIKASNVLKKNDVIHKMVPVPRHLSSDCGYCVRFNSADNEMIRVLFEKTEVEYDRIEEI